MKLIFLTLIMMLACAEPIPQNDFKSVVVLELFTSQGCSSCPPADALLEKVSEKYATSEVIVLSYHVDYWNYIGWKDPFSKSEYSDRQRAYSKKLESSSYTPQIVVNGGSHFVGSNEGKLKSAIESWKKKRSENRISLSNVKNSDGIISCDYEIDGSLEDNILEAVLTIDERVTTVARGENKNRKLKNVNIVVETKSFPLNSNTGIFEIRIPNIVEPSDDLALTLLVKNNDLQIVTANQVKL